MCLLVCGRTCGGHGVRPRWGFVHLMLMLKVSVASGDDGRRCLRYQIRRRQCQLCWGVWSRILVSLALLQSRWRGIARRRTGGARSIVAGSSWYRRSIDGFLWRRTVGSNLPVGVYLRLPCYDGAQAGCHFWAHRGGRTQRR